MLADGSAARMVLSWCFVCDRVIVVGSAPQESSVLGRQSMRVLCMCARMRAACARPHEFAWHAFWADGVV